MTIVNEIKEEINLKFGLRIKADNVKTFLKSNLKLSYKKASSRPLSYDPSKVKRQKEIFSVKISKILSDCDILVNLDKATINNSTKEKYTLLTKRHAK
mmetsp:Transcript_26898/g.23742  ORF Transcript_26898/g.23742 Transcript_26898/m.23742 type:complete len:98 (-) Transcript_26898:72-365(-)|eukprot:CAMPEP_0205815158 /NCGR_PEP_ID=MMETSP0205-20121125/20694_1 /ASSEMBLY_ACC=CAM_ASM_000278 /TAXON_ID=36767 /ORGANISM="Euplotes focardii, Strain TN1" /LENGTH=97 /DNA_ID=CAMNT_0053100721 /DNA_START=264 /DNA_END=557 /DNA_ORIENTATION=+